MSELVILCNEQEIYCDSVAYYCDGSGVKIDVSFDSTSFSDVSYVNVNDPEFKEPEPYGYLYLLSSDPHFLLDSNDLFLRVRDSSGPVPAEDQDLIYNDVRY